MSTNKPKSNKFLSILSVFNFWKAPINIYYEILEWRISNKALKEPETLAILKKCKLDDLAELRINKLGEIYTVINVPEDIVVSKTAIWPFIMEKMAIVNETIMEARLSDLLYPKVDHIPKSNSWLLTLSTEKEFLNFGTLFREFFRWIFITIIGFIIYRIVIQFGFNIQSFLGL